MTLPALLAYLQWFLLAATCFANAEYDWAAEYGDNQRPLQPTERPLTNPSISTSGKESLDQWLEGEQLLAVDRLLANIAPGGRNAGRAVRGTVLASPSDEHPDYYYQWVRDSAIVISCILRLRDRSRIPSRSSPLIAPILRSYAALQLHLQRSPNPSGNFSNLASLGEPKFLANGEPFTGEWGRPQNDGPALRALALMSHLRSLNSSMPHLWTQFGPGPQNWLFRNLYKPSMPPNTAIKADLEYVSHHWRSLGFDLWEEVHGLHFFTAMVQLRALKEGANLAALFEDQGASDWYETQYQLLRDFIARFQNKDKTRMLPTLHTDRSGLDCSILLGALHGTDEANGNEVHSPFPPWSDVILASMYDFIQDQRERFPVNSQAAQSHDLLEGVGIGRYPEDVYDGYDISIGHPWFICTASVSEVLYRTAIHFSQSSVLPISHTAWKFWHAVSPSHVTRKSKELHRQEPAFNATLHRLVEIADSFLGVIRVHADSDGGLSEQFDRVTGFERGARDLTWSYGSLLEAIIWRELAKEAIGVR